MQIKIGVLIAVLQLLHELLRFNTQAIDFWLATCKFPCETRQFTQSLKQSAWHLTHRDASSKARSRRVTCSSSVIAMASAAIRLPAQQGACSLRVAGMQSRARAGRLS